jgi:hypothetical protein
MPKNPAALAQEMDRKKLSTNVRHQLLMEAGYKCGNPACRNVITLELHHIEYVCAGGGDENSNLLVLCPYCHSLHHAGHIPVEAIRLWKGLLVALNHAFDRQGMELLLYLHRTNPNQLMYSADGALKFAGLIGAGLVEIAETDMTFMAPNERKMFRQTSHKLALTQRGKLLIEAWLSGREKDYRDLISSSNPGIAGENA